MSPAWSKTHSLLWAKKLIKPLWNYLDSLWKQRNLVLYRKDEEEAAELDRRQLYDNARAEYT